jgi:hypothetical protein
MARAVLGRGLPPVTPVLLGSFGSWSMSSRTPSPSFRAHQNYVAWLAYHGFSTGKLKERGNDCRRRWRLAFRFTIGALALALSVPAGVLVGLGIYYLTN